MFLKITNILIVPSSTDISQRRQGLPIANIAMQRRAAPNERHGIAGEEPIACQLCLDQLCLEKKRSVPIYEIETLPL
jgi:hypothetical protein